MTRFNRAYELMVGKPGQLGDLIKPPIHITFDITKDDSEQPNQAVVRIWNLAKETRESYEESDNVLLLNAGYLQEDHLGECLVGNVVDAWTKRDEADIITELIVMDGYVPMRDTAVSLSYGEGASSADIIKKIASEMGLSLSMGDVPHRRWRHGFSFYGAATEALHKVVRGTGLEWSIQNGTLQIIQRDKTNIKEIFVLNSQSGMIGSPERLRKGASEQIRVKDERTGDNKDVTSTKQPKDGWRVKSLLLPAVVPGDQVRVESMSIEGNFRVNTVHHTGDWGGTGDWMTELEVSEL